MLVGESPSGFLIRKIHGVMAEMPRDKVFARWYGDKGYVESARTFHGIWAASGEIAYLLRSTLGLNKGDRVVLAFNFGLRFFVVFLGCLRAGVVAVPVYPPNPATLKKSLGKLSLIVESCEPKMIFLCPLVNKLRLASKLRAVATGNSGWPDLPYHCPMVKEETPSKANTSSSPSSSSSFRLLRDGRRTSNADERRKSFDDPSIKAADVAFLQFTSGSTSDPKGVMITFGNLDHNISSVLLSSNMEIAARGGPPPQDGRAWFSWLPTFHDMGLIQGTLVPFVGGWTAAYCSPISFLRRPLVWLELMSKEKSQMTAAPDFAYRLCVRKWKEMTLEAQAALNLDLRHVMFMQNAAEPVRSSTGRDFAEAFAAVGLPAHFLNAAYGLAEHTVGCSSFSPNPEGRNLALIPDEQLEASGNMEFSRKLGHVKIVDPETSREMPDGETGEMWVSSASVAAGYWGKPELTNETFHARIECDKQDGTSPPLWADFEWLRTGDLCRIDPDGLLYVKGRIKDLIIVAGRNIYPQDIEFSAQEASPLVRPGCVAAFSEEELGGSLQIVLEIRKTAKGDSVAIREALEAVRAYVISESGLCPSTVVAIRERCIPKTTSGKIQRRKTRALLQSGGLDVVQELSKDSGPPLLQATRAVAPALAHDPNGPETIPPPAKAGTPVDRTVHLSKTARTSADSEDSLSEECNGGSVAHRVNFPLQAEQVLGIIEAVTGMEDLRLSDDLLNLGVDSLSAVGISSKLSEASGLEIPPELAFTHPNASLIAEYVRSQGGSLERIDQAKVAQGAHSLPRELDQGTYASSAMSADGLDSWNCPGGSHSKEQAEAWTMGPMRGWAFRLSQVLLLVLVVAQALASLQPAWHYWKFLDELALTPFGGFAKQPWLYVDLPVFAKGAEDTVRTPGLLVALAPIIWFASFTVMVIVAKWLVLGTQAQGCIPLGTQVYLSWWYTNTMLSVWETTGGRWLLDTKLAILFYRMMGAKVAWSASVKGFLREFDSIHIREGAKVAGELYARRFEASYMLVMPIVIGEGATVASGAVVYGGTNVGEYCVVSPLTVIPPSSKLARNSTWEGHPAKRVDNGLVDSDDTNSRRTPCTCDFGALVLENPRRVFPGAAVLWELGKAGSEVWRAMWREDGSFSVGELCCCWAGISRHAAAGLSCTPTSPGASEGAEKCFLVAARRRWLERMELGAAARRKRVRGGGIAGAARRLRQGGHSRSNRPPGAHRSRSRPQNAKMVAGDCSPWCWDKLPPGFSAGKAVLGTLKKFWREGAGSCWTRLFGLMMRHLSVAQLTSVLGLLLFNRQSPLGYSTPVLAKQGSIAFTLAAVVSMTYAPTILHESMGISDAFRYSSPVSIILEIIGVGTQLALLTILLKWALAGRVEGIYQPNAFRAWRRWYLGRLHTFVQAYFLVFNRFRRYDWWGAALGMSVGTGSVILLAYNPEDAHLYKVGGNAHLANPTLSADRATGIGSEREKKTISIGSRAMIGEGSYLGAGSTVGSSSLLGGYALVRPGEKLADRTATMCDVHSAYQLGASAPSSPPTDSLDSRGSAAENLVDAACSLGAWLLNALALVTTLEATKFCAEFSPRHSTVFSVVLSTFAIMAWALSTAVLLALFRWIIGGNFHVIPSTEDSSSTVGPGFNRDVETGLRKPARKKASMTLGGCQVMRWRWMRRVLSFSLFEPFVLEPLLKGTWLLNAWLRLMGADVSMGALILGRVSDYGGVTVCDRAVVAGVVYGHVATFVDGKWTMTVGPSTVGERAVVHEHVKMFCAHADAGSTMTACSSSIGGQVLQAGRVYGGRPSKPLTGSWVLGRVAGTATSPHENMDI